MARSRPNAVSCKPPDLSASPCRPPQWGEDHHYAGPLPKWCGHRHPKGPASTAAQRFPDDFIDKLLEGINKKIVRSKATDGVGKMAPATMAPATLSPDGEGTWTNRAGGGARPDAGRQVPPTTAPVSEGELDHLGRLPEQATTRYRETAPKTGMVKVSSSAGGRPEPDLADRDTSDDDEDGVPRPKRGSGNVGYGRPMPARWGGGQAPRVP
jgi:hypothetical protein